MPPEEAPQKTEQFLEVDGRRIFCFSAGRGDPLILLHGLCATSHSWRRVWARLALKRRVHVLDWLGHGRSDAPADFEYSVASYVGLLAGVMDRLGIQKADLAGNSMGGMATLGFALRHPERTRKLVLIGTPAYPSDRPKLLWTLRRPVIGRLFEWCLGRWTVKWGAQLSFVDQSEVTDELIDAYAVNVRTPARRRAMAGFIRNAIPPDVERMIAGYRDIRNPTLIIWGDGDSVVGRGSAQRLAKDIPNAQLKVLERCGHAPQEERPEETLSLIESFLGGDVSTHVRMSPKL